MSYVEMLPPVDPMSESTAADSNAVITSTDTRVRSWIPTHRPLVAILIGGAVVRLLLLWWFHNEQIYVFDAQHYNMIAVNLVEHGEFAISPGSPTSIRPPLYPALLAAVYSICGLENYQAVRVLQSILGLILAILVYCIAKALFSARVAAWAATMCCFYPSLLGFGNLLLTETLFSIFLCLACLMLQRFLQHESLVRLVLLGVFLGLAALTRSVLWLFPPFLIVFLLWADSEASWPRRLTVAGAPVVAFVLTIMPWAVRNTLLQKTFTTIDVMGGRNFMMGNYEYTPLHRAWDAVSLRGDKAWHQILSREYPDYGQRTQGQRDKVALRRGITFVLDHPCLTAKRDLVKFLNFWQLERSLVAGIARGWWGELSTPAILVLGATICGSYAVAIVLAVFGFVMTPPADRRMHWFLLLLVGFICAVHTAVFGHSRYHVSLMPLALIYSSSALVNLRPIWRSKWGWSFWVAGGISTVLAGSWLWEILVVDYGRFCQEVLSRGWP